jgi:phage-related protein
LNISRGKKILKDVQWCGDSLEIIRQWPIGVRATIGEDLRRLQKGETPRDWKPFPGLVANAFELRDQDKNGAYRAIYVTIIKSKVVVLHCFKKTTSKTEKGDVNLANKRLKDLLANERKPER